MQLTVAEVIDELFYPILGLLGVLLRPLGTLGLGFVAGRVVRYTLAYKLHMRFYVPLVFLGAVLLFGMMAHARWSSPGALAALGIGAFVGYVFMKIDQAGMGEEYEVYEEEEA
jgi:hypothetical protein